MKDFLFVTLQHLLPKQLLTRIAGRFAYSSRIPGRHAFMSWFVSHYKINLEEAACTDLKSYPSFNAFFTRPLKHNARPLLAESHQLVSPVDGCVSQLGDIVDGELVQAKGHTYSVADLLGGKERASPFQKGNFVTIYLSPKDYHRIHMPCKGELREMVHVPGALYSVNPATARGVKGLFARNERVVAIFDTARGPMAMVLVGATIVGSIETVWAGQITPPRRSDLMAKSYAKGEVVLERGAEMGRFLLGSTVICLWGEDAMQFVDAWEPEKVVRLHEIMGQ